MVTGNYRGITAVLVVLIVCSGFGAAWAAKKAGAGNSEGWVKYWTYDALDSKPRVTLPVIRGNVESRDYTLNTPVSSNNTSGGSGYYETSITLLDSYLLPRSPKEVTARRTANVTAVAKSQTVQTRAAETAYREFSRQGLDTMYVSNICQSAKLTPVNGGYEVTVGGEGHEEVARVAQAVAAEIITRCQELDRTPKPLLSVVEPVRIHPAKEPGYPLWERLLLGLAFWPESGLRGCIGIFVGILLGALAGAALGRRIRSGRLHTVLCVMVVLALVGAGVLFKTNRQQPDLFNGSVTLICDPNVPATVPAEIVKLARSGDVVDKAVDVLGQLGINATPESVLKELKVEQDKESGAVSIEVTTEVEGDSKAIADIVAGETLRRYSQVHAKDGSAQAVQMLEPGHPVPVQVHQAAHRILIFGVPAAALLIAFLAAYPIACRRRGK